jgi:hypothetical protein
MKIMYIRDSKRRPVGVLVYERNKEENSVKYGFSACAPSDKFNKQLGLQLAVGRLHTSPVHATQHYSNKVESTHDALSYIMYDLLDSDSKTARDFAQSWRNTHLPELPCNLPQILHGVGQASSPELAP